MLNTHWTRARSVVAAAVAILLTAFAIPDVLADDDDAEDEVERLEEAREVFLAIKDMPDAEVPDQLLERCSCIAVFPGVVKGALGWGGRRGKGVISCRNEAGAWSPPAFLTITGGSFGLQIGVEKADVVLFFMSEKGARSMLESKFTLGGSASVAAGPVGRTAEAGTDIKLDAEIYSYARTKGLFAGLSLEGARVAPSEKAVKRFYGQKVEPEEILFEHEVPSRPEAIQKFTQILP